MILRCFSSLKTIGVYKGPPRKPSKIHWVLWCFQHRGSRGRLETRIKNELEIGCVLGVKKCQKGDFVPLFGSLLGAQMAPKAAKAGFKIIKIHWKNVDFGTWGVPGGAQGGV